MKRIAFLITALFLASLLLFASIACDPPGPDVRIVNPTAQDLFVSIDGRLFCAIRFEDDNTYHTWMGFNSFTHLVEAKNSKGEVVYSEELDPDEFKERDWTIVIPTSPEVHIWNESQKSLVILVDGNPVQEGTGDPNRSGFPITTRLAVPIGLNSEQVKYRIEALNQNLEVVFAQEFTYRELAFMHWRITIPPPESK